MNGDVADAINAAAKKLAIESRSLLGLPESGADCWASSSKGSSWCTHLARPPSAVQFLRILNRHLPVIIEGCMDDRPCMDRWQDSQYLVDAMGSERRVQVAATPNGRADDIHRISRIENGLEARLDDEGNEQVFVLPHEQVMTFAELMNALKSREQTHEGPIVYLQSQNSNLTTDDAAEGGSGDLSPLRRDVCPQGKTLSESTEKKNLTTLPWADEALGKQPEATNLWIGSQASKTSMHRDHYENLFTVVRGTKIFTLYPPCEAFFLCEDEPYNVWEWEPRATTTADWTLKPASGTPPTPWIPIDPTEPPASQRNRRFPRFAEALQPLVIEVRAGETLYLPAGWYHHVAQRGDEEDNVCICVNWWYESDFAFSDRWALETFVQDIGRLAK